MHADLSFSAIWSEGDPVGCAVTLLLIAMSLVTWIVIALRTIDLIWQRRLATRVESFWHSCDLEEGLARLGPSCNNPFHLLASRGQEAFVHISPGHRPGARDAQPQLHDRLDVSDWVTRGLHQSIDISACGLQSGMAVLGSIGSTAPFIGLFGTVWGIYHALAGIGSGNVVSIDMVAGPIGEALIMTALGLGVAIPAVLGYNALNHGNKAALSRLRRFAHDLHAYFLTGTRVDNKSQARAGHAILPS